MNLFIVAISEGIKISGKESKDFEKIFLFRIPTAKDYFSRCFNEKYAIIIILYNINSNNFRKC